MPIFSRESTQTESTFKASIPLNPGRNVKCIIESIKFKEDHNGDATEDIEIVLKGTEEGNTGTLKNFIWASKFDENDEYFSEDSARWTWESLAHICTALITEDEFFALFKETDVYADIAKAIVDKFEKTDISKIELSAKVVYKFNAKKGQYFSALPIFTDFITSKLTPTRVLSVGNKINNKTGLPYDLFELPNAPVNDIVESDPTVTVQQEDQQTTSDDLPF